LLATCQACRACSQHVTGKFATSWQRGGDKFCGLIAHKLATSRGSNGESGPVEYRLIRTSVRATRKERSHCPN